MAEPRKVAGMITATSRTAYHEAGHAVVAVVLRRAITHVSIVPTDECLGHVQHPTGVADPDRRTIENLKEQSLADSMAAAAAYLERLDGGWMTEARYGLRRSRARDDIAIRLAGPRAEKRFSGRWDNRGARHDREHALDLADRLANDSSVTSKGILVHEDARADRILKENWPSVVAVADALLVKSHLTGREVRAIVKATK
jgi:ATP-dependent Zn protease